MACQPIDEFPFFSFLLGDMHPHVLVLPFVLLVLALAFNVAAQRERMSRVQAGLYVVCFGALAFLNTWDLPIYLFILVGAMLVRRIRTRGWFDAGDVVWPVLAGIGLALGGVLLYLPWYVSFSSQAGGILPNAIFATRFQQFFVMFGPFLVVIVWFLVDRLRAHHDHVDWLNGAVLGLGILVALIVLTAGLGAVALRADPSVQAYVVSSAGLPTDGQSEAAVAAMVPQAVQIIVAHRLSQPLTPLILTALLVVALALLLPRPRGGDVTEDHTQPPFSASTGFVLVLIVTGLLLTLGPEFVYLRDNFGQRLNTIFKFYYATWIAWAIASAYAVHVIISRRNAVSRVAFPAILTVFVLAGMVYPALSLPTKTGNFTRAEGEPPPTLDGIDYIRQQNPGDYAGIEWLIHNAKPGAVVLEAVGGPYSYYARVSMATGLPTILGWPNHEAQWRGAHYGELAGTREQDVREIYNTLSIDRARQLLQQYNVTYIFIGSLERNPTYASAAGLEKFDRYLTPVFRAEGVSIYRADEPLAQEAQP